MDHASVAGELADADSVCMRARRRFDFYASDPPLWIVKSFRAFHSGGCVEKDGSLKIAISVGSIIV